MTKQEFASAVRAWSWRAPTEAEWNKMYNHHLAFPDLPVKEIVRKHIEPKPVEPDGTIKDERKIPAEYRASALSLEELAVFGREMAERFK